MRSIISLVIVVLSFSAMAGEEAGSSGAVGGGIVISSGNQFKLLDLEKEIRCKSKTLESMESWIEKDPYASKILKKLEEKHWYFGHAFREQARQMRACDITKDSLDWITLIVRKNPGYPKKCFGYKKPKDCKVVGVRTLQDGQFASKVYFDGITRKKLPEEDHGVLLLHEVLHSFVPVDSEVNEETIGEHQILLMEATREVLSFVDDQHASPLQFEDHMKKHGVQFPVSIEDVDDQRSSFEKFWNEKSQTKDRKEGMYEIGPFNLYHQLYDFERYRVKDLMYEDQYPLIKALCLDDFGLIESEVKNGADSTFPVYNHLSYEDILDYRKKRQCGKSSLKKKIRFDIDHFEWSLTGDLGNSVLSFLLFSKEKRDEEDLLFLLKNGKSKLTESLSDELFKKMISKEISANFLEPTLRLSDQSKRKGFGGILIRAKNKKLIEKVVELSSDPAPIINEMFEALFDVKDSRFSEEISEYLLKTHYVSPIKLLEKRDGTFKRPLIEAVKSHRPRLFRGLLKGGMDPHVLLLNTKPLVLEIIDQEESIGYDFLSSVLLYAESFDWSQKDRNNQNPLEYAYDKKVGWAGDLIVKESSFLPSVEEIKSSNGRLYHYYLWIFGAAVRHSKYNSVVYLINNIRLKERDLRLMINIASTQSDLRMIQILKGGF
ncbi:MAG: hypothetical protein CL678_13005 [Bdellovibrionaceae bacterium]|nr:hypothetical protein [Pseudobdellovibrionaceae bacterium]|tara:strand:+ start:982 stop:2961 length:1980 start_codon:yes stop_codon:yes gene_type:complete